MGHADLRIKERTLPAVADRAYELLRSRQTLAVAAQAVLRTSDRPDADRVAFALEEGATPAHLLVTRDGRAVTCLAAGMACDAVKAPYGFTQGYLDHQRGELRLRLAENRAKDPEARDTLERLWRFAYRMTRDEFEALLPLAPLLVEDLNGSMPVLRDTLTTLASRATWDVRRAPVRAFGEEVWRLYCSVAMLTVLSHGETTSTWTALTMVPLMDSLLTQRAWWVLLAHPERTLEHVRRTCVNSPRLAGQGLCVMVTVAVAMRFPWLKKDAQQMARTIAASPRARPATKALVAALLDEEAYRRRINGWAQVVAAHVAAAREPGGGLEAALKGSTPLGDIPQVKRVLDEWSPWEGMEKQPVPSLRRADTVSPADERRIAVWREAIWCNPLSLCPAYHPLGMLLSNAPMEAVVPSNSPQDHNRLTEGTRFVLERLPMLLHQNVSHEAMRAADERAAKARPRAGPNEPCPCGSGKKFKKCCGAP